MRQNDVNRLRAFLSQKDCKGVLNVQKTGGNADDVGGCPGVICDRRGRLIGLGINILNKSVYPIEKFELYLREKRLCGHLDLSGCRDMVFLDVYRNFITSVDLRDMPAMRILGLQDNHISRLDVSELPACQGIDAGKNRLLALDVSKNPELVELYIHFNELTEIDLSHNPKLKYFWCNYNRISKLDVSNNPMLRHLDCTENPLKSVTACAPQRDGALPISLTAETGGYVGLKFCPVYTPQWKETGEWRQTYYAYPEIGYDFGGWYENGKMVSEEPTLNDEYGVSRVMTAHFTRRGV